MKIKKVTSMGLYALAFLLLLSLPGSFATLTPRLTLVPPPTTHIRRLGESFYVVCESNHPVSDLKWTGPHGDIPGDDTHERVHMSGDNSFKQLFILNLNDNDKGWYNCSGRHNDRWLRTGFFLDIYKGITFDAPAEQHAALGNEGIIKCVVSGTPQPTVRWKFESRLIKPNQGSRVSIEPGQIVFNPVLKEDEGVYTCEAIVPERGEFQERKINFLVYTPPEFDNDFEDKEAVEDEQIAMICSATGTPEPTYLWKGNNNNDVSGKDRFYVDHNGTMKIMNVTMKDAGEYICVAENELGEASKTFNLRVIKKPMLIRYYNITVSEERRAVLECEIWGEPMPKVTLRKLSSNASFTEGLQPDDDRITLSVTDQNSVRKITLEIVDVKRTDDGLYSCEASNKVGELYQNAHVTVEYKPTFENTPFDEAWSWNQKKVNLTCFAEAIPNATISWVYKNRLNGQEQSAKDLRNIVIHERESRSDLEVTPVDVSYFREYICIARNKLGEARHVIELKEARIPSTVNQVVFSRMTATTITFMFLGVMDDGGRPVDAYAVQYKEQKKEWDDENRKIWPINVPYILNNLKPRVTYEFRFAARNVVGFGPYGKIVVRVMPEEGEPMKPRVEAAYPDEMKVEQIEKPNSYELRWLVPNNNGKEIDLFQIEVYEVNDELEIKQGSDVRMYQIRYPGNMVYEITDLEAGHIYKIELRAHNELGFSEKTTIYIKTSNGSSVNADITQIMRNMTINDTSNYTCVANNQVTEVSIALNLQVIVKPKVTQYDSSIAAEEDTECQISGQSLPKVTLWKLNTAVAEQLDGNRITVSLTDEDNVWKVMLEKETEKTTNVED